MRLLQTQSDGSFRLVKFEGRTTPQYAILSHTWGDDDDEVNFQDLENGTGKDKAGYKKLLFCSKQAAKDGLEYFWVDTACIDKSSSQELTEAINSMFSWYHHAERCYVYLSDVSLGEDGDGLDSARWLPMFRQSRWFTRGWTLQELLAPVYVDFFSKEGIRLGNKQDLELTIHEITGIAIEAIQGHALFDFDVAERFSWAASRSTKREEDAAYCLFGIFGVFMPLIPGEGRDHAFRRLRKEVENVREKKSKEWSEQQVERLVASLHFNHIDARQSTIKNAHADTCKWLVNSEEYSDWLDTTKTTAHHGFFWIKGKPGSGKSTLMKHALVHTHKNASDRIIVSFFFNARGNEMEKSTTGAYRSILLQLLQRTMNYDVILESLGLQSSGIRLDHEWEIESLKSALEHMIQSLEGQTVIIFIDALDECDEDEVRDMVSFFQSVGSTCRNLRVGCFVCLSSRHYPNITIDHGVGLIVEGRKEHDKDIVVYLDNQLRIGKNELAEQIQTELKEKASGVFLWVVLVVNILNKEFDRGRVHALRRRLREIPGDLDNVFRDILTRDVLNKEELVLCIQWVLFAKSPLSPSALYFAILCATDPKEMEDYDPEFVDEDAMEKFVVDSSKGLVDITHSAESPSVQFIHETVRDFLLKHNGLSRIWPELTNLEGQSHEQLKKCCLNILTHPDIYTGGGAIENRQFLAYALGNVLYHADCAEKRGIPQADFIRDFPLFQWFYVNDLLGWRGNKHVKKGASMLYVLALYGCAHLIEKHLDVLSCLESQQQQYGSPLFAAMAAEQHDVVEVFLKALCMTDRTMDYRQIYRKYQRQWPKCLVFGSLFEFQENKGPLLHLAASQHAAVAETVLKTGKFDVDLEDDCGRSPLSLAAGSGSMDMVMLLLSAGADVNSKDKYRRTPLSYAAREGRTEVIKVLLKIDGIAVRSEDTDGESPFLLAVQHGEVPAAQLLVEKSYPDPNRQDLNGRTRLSIAAADGSERMVMALLEHSKIDIALSDNNGRTPLMWAASMGHDNVVLELLNHKHGAIYADKKDFYGRTPLSRAAGMGHASVVSMLLSMAPDHIDIESRDHNGRTPLSWAAAAGQESIVSELLNCEIGPVDIESEDKDGRTPISWAVERNHPAVIWVLMGDELGSHANDAE